MTRVGRGNRRVRVALPRPLAVALLAALALFAMLAAPTASSFNLARVTNSTSTALTGLLSGSHVIGSNTCAGGPGPTLCTSSAFSTAPATTTVATVNDTFTNTSTVPNANLRQQVSLEGCAPLRFASTGSVANEDMISRGLVTRKATDKWGTTSAASFDGVNDVAATYTQRSAGLLAGDYSFGTWFNAAASQGGAMLSFGPSPGSNSAAGNSSSALSLLTDGRLRVNFTGIAGAASVTTALGTAYNDGNWHLVVANVDVQLTQTTISFYIDGTLLGSASVGTLPLSTAPAGYWHLGWGADQTPNYFTGRLSGAFTHSGLMTSTTVGAMGAATSMSGYLAALGSRDRIYALGEDKTAETTASIPYLTTGNACSYIGVQVLIAGAAAYTSSAFVGADAASTGAQSGWWPTSGAGVPATGQTTAIQAQSRRNPNITYDADVSLMDTRIRYAHRLTLPGTNWTAIWRWQQLVVQP